MTCRIAVNACIEGTNPIMKFLVCGISEHLPEQAKELVKFEDLEVL
jgi:hypothetical protein